MSALVVFLLSVITMWQRVASDAPVAWNKEYTTEDFDKNNDKKGTFEKWKNAFEREYETNGKPDFVKEAKRYIIWEQNLKIISESNSQDLPYKLRLNQFGDMTQQEFKQYVQNGYRPKSRGGAVNAQNSADSSKPRRRRLLSPDSVHVDWTTKGVVTPVKNQGQCGSSWAFSATGALECNYAIKKGTLTSLSEQQLVDCAGAKYGCYGCNGGQMYGAMEYSADEGGLCSESAYKYTAKDGQCKATTCGTKYNANNIGKGYTAVQEDSHSAMVAAVDAGCVSVAIEADQYAFQYYSSGVLTGNCGTNVNLDHGVLIVGYGTSGPQDYWKVKNSWGTSWGEQGYVLICRNCDNNGKGQCGILMEGNVPNF